MPRLPNNLNPRQQAFVLAYLSCLNATQAAIQAGYSERTACEQGNDLLRKPQIEEYLAKVQSRAFERAEVSGAKVIAESARLAFMPETDDEGKWSPSRARIKTDNLNLLAKHFGLTKETIIQNNTTIFAQINELIDAADMTAQVELFLSRRVGREITIDEAVQALSKTT